MGLRAALTNLIGFLAAFGLVSTALRETLPPPNGFGLGPKVEYFREHRDDFDLVVFGSSHVRHGIVPEQLDAELGKRGVAIHSFNFGVAGMSMFELDYWFQRMFDERPARLRWVVIELGSWEPRRPDHRLFETERSVLWHSWDVTRDVLASLWQRDVPDGSRMYRWHVAAQHLELMAKRYANLGQAQRLLQRRLRGDRDEELASYVSPAEVAEHRGYRFPPEDARAGFGDVVKYRRLREELTSGTPRTAPLPFSTAAVCRMARQLEQLGVVPIFLIAPTVIRGRHPMASSEQVPECLDHLLDYQQPDRFPLLFQEPMRFDFDHLNHEGAQRLTALVADDLARILRQD